MEQTRNAISEALVGADAEMLPQLFEEFSRATAHLAQAHDALLAEVESLKQELAAKNARLERKKRLEAIGRVAAGVAHEFRNPLGGIRLSADILRREAIADAARHRVDHIVDAVTHLDRIVEDLLSYTREQELHRSPQPLRDVIVHSLQLAFPDPDSEPFELTIEGPDDQEEPIDRVAFTQVLVNLLSNARDAVDETDRPRVGVWWGRRDDLAWIEVADTGAGVPAGEEERIFHPFHTLRQSGTGLGLAIVHSRIEAHEGEITVVRTEPWGGGREWGGARFRITLPIHHSTPATEGEQR